jgi:hypothetical protein
MGAGRMAMEMGWEGVCRWVSAIATAMLGCAASTAREVWARCGRGVQRACGAKGGMFGVRVLCVLASAMAGRRTAAVG